MRRSAAGAGVAVVLALAACSTTGRPPAVTGSGGPPLQQFCGEAQKIIAKTTLPVETIVVPTKDEFGPSKATVRPLSTRQMLVYGDDAPTQLRQISCKMKTADHIVAEYGPGTAGPEGLCADINRSTLESVMRGFAASGQRRLKYGGGKDVVFDPEQVTTNGFEWLAPYPIAWQGPDGRLHVMAKAQRNDWLDARYFGADPKFRGTRYCHLIAPDYLRGILLGEIAVGTTPPPPLGTPIR
jgi:hypothetical protein